MVYFHKITRHLLLFCSALLMGTLLYAFGVQNVFVWLGVIVGYVAFIDWIFPKPMGPMTEEDVTEMIDKTFQVEFPSLKIIEPTQEMPENFNKHFLCKEIVKALELEDPRKCYFKIIGERIVKNFGVVTTAVIEINLKAYCILSRYNEDILKDVKEVYSDYWTIESGFLVFPLNADVKKVVKKLFNQS